MKEDKSRQALGQAIDNALSGIQEDAWLAQRVLRMAHEKSAPAKGGRIAKRKLSIGLVLLLCLLLTAAAAVAWTLSQQYFEDVADLQASAGFYADWSLADKQQMVDILLRHGLISQQQARQMTTEAAIDAFMIARYGADGQADAISLWAVLEKELGPIEGWSLEDRAWYSKMQRTAGLQDAASDEPIYALPEDEDITPEQAIALAKQAIIAAFALPENALEPHTVEIYFQHYPNEAYSEMHYDITFRGDNYADTYSCSITHDGQIMDSSMGKAYLSPAELVQQKQQFLLENDLEVSALFTQYAQAHITGDFEFAFWPLADKKAVTDMLRPVIAENMTQNPDYADQTCIFWATHFYGLPDEAAISQQEAIAIARQQLTLAHGLTEAQAALLDKVGLFYEVTDAANPVWKITLRAGESRDEAAHIQLPLDVKYRVVIQAYTGSVVQSQAYTNLVAGTVEYAALSN